MTRVAVNPEVVRWARERARRTPEDLAGQFRKLPQWESGEVAPTLRQAEAFARAVHLPVGYLFLAEPPDEPVPIPDFRTVAGRPMQRPSPDLLDTIYACQERQSWYRDFARVERQPELSFVGSATTTIAPEMVAARMRATLGLDVATLRECSASTDALRLLIRGADEAGVLVMVSGVVRSSNRRGLDPAEFGGFALSDPVAPLVFVNGAATTASQMFSLAHELAHLWLGVSALSSSGAAPGAVLRREEVWCNAVAAELVSPLAESAGVQAPARGAGSGNCCRTILARVGRRFARAVVGSTLEGRTLYRDAFRMLGVSKARTFDKLSRELGLIGP